MNQEHNALDHKCLIYSSGIFRQQEIGFVYKNGLEVINDENIAIITWI